MGFFKTLLRIVTLGIIGKERTPAEVALRKKLVLEKVANEQALKKQLSAKKK